MNLNFLRHAKAYPRSAKFRPDSKRPLTPEGEEKMREVAAGMRELDLAFDLILTSPYARALRTADIAAEVLEARKPVTTDNLTPEADARKLIDEINTRYASIQEIVLVGHEPFMSDLISVLLSGSAELRIDFRKAGLCRLSTDALQFGKCACLEWLLTPRQLARLGR